MPRATLYSKRDCHLCDQAAEILEAIGREMDLQWRRVDIESDPALFARFRYDIPVIEVAGGVTLKWPTTRERVRRALASADGGGRAG